MKNYVFYLLAFLGIMLTSCESNELASDDPTTDPTDVYIAGYSKDTFEVEHAFLSKNGAQISLAGSEVGSTATKVVVSNGDVYVLGEIDGKSTLWKNGQIFWQDTSTDVIASYANDLKVVGNDVYISGVQVDQSTNFAPVYWKNGVKTLLDNFDYASTIQPVLIDVSGNDVYVAALHYENTFDIVYWKNGVRNIVSENTNHKVTDLVVQGNDVYMAGYLDWIQGEPGVGVYWKNGIKTDVSNSLYITGIAVENNNVYLAGIGSSGSVANTWLNLSPTTLTGATSIDDIFVKNGNVYLIGYDSTNQISKSYINGVSADLPTNVVGTSIFAD